MHIDRAAWSIWIEFTIGNENLDGFYLRIRGKLNGVDHHGSVDGGDSTTPQRGHAFLLDYPEQGVENVSVVASFVQRKSSVRRHPDQADLGRGPDERTARPSSDTASGLRQETWGFTFPGWVGRRGEKRKVKRCELFSGWTVNMKMMQLSLNSLFVATLNSIHLLALFTFRWRWKDAYSGAVVIHISEAFKFIRRNLHMEQFIQPGNVGLCNCQRYSDCNLEMIPG